MAIIAHWSIGSGQEIVGSLLIGQFGQNGKWRSLFIGDGGHCTLVNKDRKGDGNHILLVK